MKKIPAGWFFRPTDWLNWVILAILGHSGRFAE